MAPTPTSTNLQTTRLHMWIIVTVVLATLTLRGSRAAYVAYMLYAVLFIPARAGFQMQALLCEYPVSVASGLYSLQKWGHIFPSAIVSLMTVAQFRKRGLAAFSTALAVTVALGLLAELEQGFFRDGNCRMRDLVPDTAGATLGLIIAFVWWRARRPAPSGPSPASAAEEQAGEQRDAPDKAREVWRWARSARHLR